MKQSLKCPKCNSDKIFHKLGALVLNNWSRIQVSITSLDIWVTKYICTDCGFIEEWIDNPNDLARLKAKIDYSDKPASRTSPT